MEQLKTVLANVLVQYILKVGSGVFLTLGVSETSILEVVTAVVMFVLGTIGHWIQHNTALNAPPPTTRVRPTIE